jgi:hypothetical protein
MHPYQTRLARSQWRLGCGAMQRLNTKEHTQINTFPCTLPPNKYAGA